MQPTTTASDDSVLYPMQESLSRADLFKLRGGLVLWLLSMAIPILLLIETRFLMVGSYVAPNVNQGIGIAAGVVLLLSGVFASMANRGAKQGNEKAVLTQYGWTILFGLAGWVLIGIQVVNRSMSTASHYGETYLVTAGAVDFYILCTLIAIYAARSRVKRLGGALKNYWGVHSSTTAWWFVVIVWLVLYVELYLI